MRCPYCGSVDDKVVESRTLGQGDCIRRRRECLSCGYRFTSYERIEEKPLMVVKRNGRREPFDRAKLERGKYMSIFKKLRFLEMLTCQIWGGRKTWIKRYFLNGRPF